MSEYTNDMQTALDMAADAMEMTGCDFEECFPYEGFRTIRVGSQLYRVRTTIEITPIEE